MSEIWGNTAEDVVEGADALSVKIGGDNVAAFVANMRTLLRLMSREGSPVRPVAATVSALRSSDVKDNVLALPEVNKRLEKKGGKAKGFDTTGHLQYLSDAVAAGDISNAERALNAVWEFTQVAIKRSHKLSEEDQRMLLSELEKKIQEFRANICQKNISSTFVNLGLDSSILDTQGRRISLVGFGEDLARQLYMVYLIANGHNPIEIPNFMDVVFQKDADPSKIIHDISTATEVVINGITEIFEKNGTGLYVSGGHQPVAASSRGYSDVVAAWIAAAFQKAGYGRAAVDVHKQDPVLSADPRTLGDKAKVIRLLGLDTAGELFGKDRGANAAAFHPKALEALRAYSIPAVARNPHKPEKGATLMTDGLEFPEGPMDVIATQSIPAAVSIRGLEMIDRNGVLNFITDFFREFSVRIDIDSAGSILLCFNDDIAKEFIDDFKERLANKFGDGFKENLADNPGNAFSVEILPEAAIVYCVGNNPNLEEQHAVGLATLRVAGIKTFGGSHKPIDSKKKGGAGVSTFVISQNDVPFALAALHANMIEDPQTVKLVSRA